MIETYLMALAVVIIICSPIIYRAGYKKGYRDGYTEGFDYRGKCVYGDWYTGKGGVKHE